MDDFNGVISAGASLGGDYDELPYVSLPIAYTEPGRLAALARLYGFGAPDVPTAKILELGCASGGNIIPLAARYPRAQFLGVDLGERHVEEAHGRILQLGLDNIEVRQADLTTLALEKSAFDFIICHGVYSWVPDHVQTAILDLCSRCLTDNGIAAISYNVFPGWHLRNVIRDICLSHDQPSRPVRERVAVARAAIQLAADTANGGNSYGRIVREEAQRLARQPASYILGEFLTATNLPCLFKDFAGRIARHGLTYVCEGDLPSSVPAMFLPNAAKRIAGVSADDPIARQHYCDLISGRTFRRSILVKSSGSKRPAEPTPNTSLDGLHIAAKLTLAKEHTTSGPIQFVDHRGQSLRAKDESVGRAFRVLGDCYPSTVPVKRLLDTAVGRARRQLSTALMRLVAEGRATVSTVPLQAGGTDTKRPRVWPVALLEAASGQPWATSLKHTAVQTNPALCAIYASMDGRSTVRDLASRLDALLASRKLKLGQSYGGTAIADASFDGVVSPEAFIAKALHYAASHALLLPGGASS